MDRVLRSKASNLSGSKAFIEAMQLDSPVVTQMGVETFNMEAGDLMMLLGEMSQSKTAKITGNPKLEAAYQGYLKRFIQRHSHPNDPYRGANPNLKPTAYDEVISNN